MRRMSGGGRGTGGREEVDTGGVTSARYEARSVAVKWATESGS